MATSRPIRPSRRGRPIRSIRPDRRVALGALALALAVAAIYGPTARHGFITFDDDTYLFANPQVTRGLSLAGLRWAFGYHAGNWHPLTWISHMLDAELFGSWAGGHHLVSAGLHAANAAVLLGLLAALTGAYWRSAAVAALFALHPLRVESVAWAAERKDVLSSLFWLLATAAYLGYARRPSRRRYLAALGLFALGLTAKPMLVTLPFVLLLLDWWPLGRGPAAGARAARERWRLLAEKAPFFALSAVSSLATLRGQTVDVLPSVSPEASLRLANAAVSYLRYLGSVLWPGELAFLYPYPKQIPAAVAAGAAFALAGISAAALAQRRRRPYLAVGWLWFLGTLVPVIGLVQVGGQARSDRYTYLTTTGVAMSLVWLAAEAWPRRAALRRLLAAALALALTALAASAARSVRFWKDSLTLFEHTVAVTADNFLVLNNLGSIYLELGRTDEALRVLRDAELANPLHCNAPYNRGFVLIRLGRYAEALAPLSRALECYRAEGRGPAYVADTLFNMGLACNRLGRYVEAERHLRAVQRIAPHFAGLEVALGEALAGLRRAGR